MIKPQYLKSGDKIGIIATARKVSLAELETCIKVFKTWGLEVVLAPNLFLSNNQFAGEDSQRATDLQWAIDHKELKAVIVARGGYGTSRIIDNIDFSNITSKWFIGFSDVTVLLSQLYQNGLQSVHGPIALHVGKDGYELSDVKLKSILFNLSQNELNTLPHKLNKLGNAKGDLIGGNLSILHTILGTASDINYDGKILFLEDLDEYLYHIDRMIVHLDRAGKFKNLAGLVVGYMSDMNDNKIPFGKTAYEIIFEHLSKYDFPVVFGMPIGHEPQNDSVIIGGNYSLNVTEKECTLLEIKNKLD